LLEILTVINQKIDFLQQTPICVAGSSKAAFH
jgi:hypothetical protein